MVCVGGGGRYTLSKSSSSGGGDGAGDAAELRRHLAKSIEEIRAEMDRVADSRLCVVRTAVPVLAAVC